MIGTRRNSRRNGAFIVLVAAALLCACSGSRSVSDHRASPSAPSIVFDPVLPSIAYTIQVGAFSSAARAARLSKKLQQAGLDAYYFIDNDQYYKVRFERFDTKSAARRRAIALQSRGMIEAYYVVSPHSGARTSDAAAVLETGLVRTARQFIGTPYRWGGASAATGFDCSGLTMTVYRLNGLHLPRSAKSQYRTGRVVAKRSLRRGDLVFFATGTRGYVSHVGIYIGAGRFVHAPGRGKYIRTAELQNNYFKRRYLGARRYF